jgi:hypothetical protein
MVVIDLANSRSVYNRFAYRDLPFVLNDIEVYDL